MKKILIIFFVLLLISCSHKNAEDVRKVKKGISVNGLKYIMGEPEDVEVQPGSEEWLFYYDGGGKRLNGLEVTIQNDKVVDFYSY